MKVPAHDNLPRVGCELELQLVAQNHSYDSSGIDAPIALAYFCHYSRYTGGKPVPTAAMGPGFRRESKRGPS
jgi:hypothetical protein